MSIRTTAIAFIVSSFIVSSSAIAQQGHIMNVTAMRQAIASQSATEQQNRNAVLGVLRQPQVQVLANRLGLDVTRAENAVATLSGAELSQLATQARTANTQLAGGSNTVIISTSTLLLIVIIVILLVR